MQVNDFVDVGKQIRRFDASKYWNDDIISQSSQISTKPFTSQWLLYDILKDKPHHYSFNFDSPYFEGKIIVAISVRYSVSCKL